MLLEKIINNNARAYGKYIIISEKNNDKASETINNNKKNNDNMYCITNYFFLLPRDIVNIIQEYRGCIICVFEYKNILPHYIFQNSQLVSLNTKTTIKACSKFWYFETILYGKIKYITYDLIELKYQNEIITEQTITDTRRYLSYLYKSLQNNNYFIRTLNKEYDMINIQQIINKHPTLKKIKRYININHNINFLINSIIDNTENSDYVFIEFFINKKINQYDCVAKILKGFNLFQIIKELQALFFLEKKFRKNNKYYSNLPFRSKITVRLIKVNEALKKSLNWIYFIFVIFLCFMCLIFL
jgi:hypothetical protein